MGSKREKCIVYGGGGFIGSHLVEALLDKGYAVTVFDKPNFSHKNIEFFIEEDGPIEIIEGDFNNEVDIERSLEGIDYVYHLVSSTLPATSNQNPIYDVETNLVSSLRLLEACVKNKIKKVLFVSSGGTVYGIPKEVPIREDHPRHPICSYGIIKKTIEDYLYMYYKIYGLDYFVFRVSNPYGEKQNPNAIQGAIPVFLSKICRDEAIEIWGDGSVSRDYVYIKDVADVLAGSLKIESEEKVFNVGTGKGESLNDLVDVMKKVTGKQVKVNYKEGRSLDVPVNILDVSLAKVKLSWEPSTSLEEGIARTYKYIKDNIT